MGGQRWKVVGDSVGEGVRVRRDRELSSPALPEQLPRGAVVEETDLVGECLQFKRISGIGPITGWVDVRENGREVLVKVATPARRTKPVQQASAVVPPPQATPSAVIDSPVVAATGRSSKPTEQLQVVPEVDPDYPLGGWAKLAEHYSHNPQRRVVAAAAETSGQADGLPPIDDLESASAEMLMDLLGFPEDAAQEFVKMPPMRKRRIIAESKALIAMSHDQRQNALSQLRKAWPRGPMPSFTSEDFGPDLLPEGCCFPLSRNLNEEDVRLSYAWGTDAASRSARKAAAARRRYAPAAAQKEALQALRCDITCAASPVTPEPGARVVHTCHAEGTGTSRDQISGMVMAKGQLRGDDVVGYFNNELKSRICLLDGDISARLDAAKLSEADYRGERYKNFKEVDAAGQPISLLGNTAILALTKPSLLIDIHKEFLTAGSDIIRTNTFEASSLALGRYKLQKSAYDLNKAAAQLAKRATAEATKRDKKKPRFVAGVLAPSPGSGVAWDALVASYDEQIRGLMEGGVDLLTVEAAADPLGAKAAAYAVEAYFERTKKKRVPLMINAFVEDADGRTAVGATLEAFRIAVKHARPLSFGFACPVGPAAVKDLCKSMADTNLSWSSFCPGAKSLEPEKFAAEAADQAKEGLLNFVGGGTGALPSHIAALAKHVTAGRARPLPPLPASPVLELSGLEAFHVRRDGGCTVVGQRCTQMGSARFKTLVDAFKATGDEAKLQEALKVAVSQCERHADILDVNLDSDSVAGTPVAGKGAMGKFLRLCAAERKVAKAPFMLCSCEWDVIKEGLQSVPGKSIVSGICLMLGEEEFLRIARECQRYGAALVVLAIGEKGQADSYEDKVRLCQKAYRLLRARLDFPAEDIIFDCQVMLLGAPENAGYATDFFNAVAEIKRTCPGVSFVGGVSNLSMPFRGLTALRDALHSVFLHHAVPKGLNLALVEAGAVPRYGDLDAETKTLCEELVLNKSPDGDHLERFLAHVNFSSNQSVCLPVSKRLPGTEEVLDKAGTQGVSLEGRETQQGVVAKRIKTTPQEQKTYWRSLSCTVSCSGSRLTPEAGAGLTEACRVEGAIQRDQLVGRILAKERVSSADVSRCLNAELGKRVCILDLNVAARLKAEKLVEADFRGTRFKDSSVPLAGNIDLLALSKPDLVLSAYKESLKAGADICSTNTLNGCAIGQEVYKTESAVYDLNKAAAELAKKATAEVTRENTQKPRFVAGVIGPTSSTLSTPPRGETDPATRNVTWEELVDAYTEQVRGLVDGGVDLLAISMVTDTLNAKAAVCAIDGYFDRTGQERPPLLISAQLSGEGNTLSGQSLHAFLVSMRHARPLAVGVSGEASQLRAACKILAGVCTCWCFAAVGPDGDTTALVACVKDKLLNFVGGGGAPSRTAELAKAVGSAPARELPAVQSSPPMQLSGLEAYTIGKQVQVVGQRCNMTGSAKFRGLVDAYKYTKKGNKWDAALQVCLEQLENGADVLDVNLDADTVDGQWAMGKFMRLCAAEPRIAKVPFMLSSASWPVIEEGLRNVQGKCIVNAISLVQGEQEFLRLAKACRQFGAAVVVIAVEKQEEFPKYLDKVRICQRCYKLLRTKLDFPAEDIIFDCSVTPVGTLDASPDAAVDFMEATAEIKRTCPGVSCIGGVSNLSLPFRGIGLLREALHSAFLLRAIPKGLNFAIIDTGKLPRHEDLEAPTATLCNEVIANDSRDGNHVSRLLQFASFLQGSTATEEAPSMEVALPEQALPLALLPQPIKPSPAFRKPIETLVQATGTINASLFQTFGSKCHAAANLHRITMSISLKRNVLFSSISAYMGQGGSGPVPGASSFLDGIAMWERHQGLHGSPISVQWGAIGEIGLRRAIYGSRDVFAQFDLGQKLIGPADTQYLERAIMTGQNVPEFLGMAYLDDTWQNTLAGKNTGGGGLEGRKTFADV